MTNMMPYLGWSIGIHLTVVVIFGWGWIYNNKTPNTSFTQKTDIMSLVLAGHPVPSHASTHQFSMAAQKAEVRLEPSSPSQDEENRKVELLETASLVGQKDDPTKTTATLLYSSHRANKNHTKEESLPINEIQIPAGHFDLLTQRIQQPHPSSVANMSGQSGLDQQHRSSATTDSYLTHIRQRIEHSKHYPPLARRAGEEGRMIFSVAIDRQGKVSRVDLIFRDASERLVAAGRRAIEDASPFDCPPSHWADGLIVQIPIRFTTVSPLTSP